MKTRTTMPFGLWPSAMSPRMLAEGRRLSDVCWDSDGERLVWLEGRGAQNVLVVVSEEAEGGFSAPRDLTPELSCRARVGYGGGDFTVSRGQVYFVEAQSGRIFRQNLSGGTARPITPAFGWAASPRVSPDGRWLAYVHHDGEGHDRIAVVDTDGKYWPQILAEGRDFYTQVRWSPDGQHIAFVAWNFPHMPWDSSSLFLAPVSYEKDHMPKLGLCKCVAGGQDRAVYQPEFAPDSRSLIYVSDESGWNHLYQFDLSSGSSRRITTAEDFEHGRPNWVQEMRDFVVSHDGLHIYAVASKRGFARLWCIEITSGDALLIDSLSQYTDVSQPTLDASGRRLAMVASSATISPRIVVWDLALDQPRVVARSTSESLRIEDLSQPVAITWKATRTEEAHGLFYPPASQGYAAEGKPPLVVIIHGGPTSQVRAGWAAQAQFFATRGYGVLFVNHRGSTGYGRDYMLKQREAWGIVDVEDAVSGAQHMVETGRADGDRLVIMGGSAGGYTVLQTMVTAPEAFAAGIVLYGISNQFTLISSTHKFESRYSDMLLGPLPEAAAAYRERSPLFHAHKIKRPLAIFQGDSDKVVPPEQSDAIVKALQRNGTPHTYQVYQSEGHGWRKPETIEHFYAAVEAFLREHVLYR